MLPVIALVGRPNVGKSTLFNCLTLSRDALVADYPGLTRDRQYGHMSRDDRECLVVDTGGITDKTDGVGQLANRQVNLAIDEADLLLFLVDAREGLVASDQIVAGRLRKTNKPIILVLNKIDGVNIDLAALEFHALGLGVPVSIAASQGRGITELLHRADKILPEISDSQEDDPQGIGIAIIGRPNVGKSTLVNRLLGEERVVVYDQPGTTRDSIFIPFERNGNRFRLIDTAGIRRRARVKEGIEKFSVIKALKAIDKANVVIYLIDASEGVTDQDANLLGMVVDAGRALVIGLNKWDGLTQDQRSIVKRQIDLKLSFVEFAEKHFISALHGTGVGNLFDVVNKVYNASMLDMSTSDLTQILKKAVEFHQPPLVKGRRVKLKYAHQGGNNPPVVVIHGNQTNALPATYRRYLINVFRDQLSMTGTPLRLELKSSENPYRDRRNKLTERQVRSRKRLMRHVKKRK